MYTFKRIVAIVGRPNVGKSTLFNRLSGTGKNVAIVDDKPGVTRDRNYIDCNWCGQNFTLVDTGGLDPTDSDHIFVTNTGKQVKKAIQEASVILFVVDINDGINPLDTEVAELLRRSGKTVILVINKIDYKTNYDLYVFAKLGFKEKIEVSASHGINIGNLLDDIVRHLSTTENNEDISDESLIKIAIVGKPNVGKSSLTNFILGEERSIVTEVPGTTRDSIHSYFQINDKNYMLIDTAGIRKLNKISDNIEFYSVNRSFKSIEQADVVLLLLDGTDAISEQDEKIAGYIEEAGKACILVVNKWDIVDKSEQTINNTKEKIYERMPFMDFAPMVFISAHTGLKVNKLLELIPQIYSLYTSRISTNNLNKVFRNILAEKRPIFSNSGKNKLVFISQAGIKPPSFLVFHRGTGKLYETYIRYIKNKIRANFPFTGVPIRIKIKKSNPRAVEGEVKHI
ncbi:ribosome biogenesis GTPase Der [Candidatus Poribacteria bacterium]|nr:ribosome biogenesis GTPase Der [Candidatus Poribacteria bacterium]